MKLPCQTNTEYASFIISTLVKLGVDTFCLGSGSRSVPLANALQNCPSADALIHYDERSLGFFALGIAKAKNAPVCIITTSGSAVANIFPAVMEAFMDGIPLIVLTTDRPFEDLDRGMNQTCDQENIFGKYVLHTKSFPSAPHNFCPAALSSHLSFFVAEAKQASLPVHLNISFKEPLLDTPLESTLQPYSPQQIATKRTLTPSTADYLLDILSSYPNGIIVAGGSYDKGPAEDLLTLAEKLHYPILADPLSNVRELGSSSAIITHYNQILLHTKTVEALKPDVILFIGGHVVSKSILLWAKSLKQTKQIVVSNKKRHLDTTLQTDIFLQMSPSEFTSAILPKVQRKEPTPFLSLWKSYAITVEKGIEDFFDDKDEIFEPTSLLGLLQTFSATPLSLFAGNGLSIRYVDNFFFPKKITGKIYGNRGVSGIDGNISTALGLCYGLQKMMVAIIGDGTFLYDVGALQLMSTLKIPLLLVVINNNGGGIYHFLPYKNEKKLLDKLVSPPTNLDIGKIASSFGIPYWKATMKNDYTKMIEHQIEENTGAIIEIPSNKEENVQIHQELEAYIEKCIAKSMKKERTSYFSLPTKKKKAPYFASTDS